MVNEKGAKKTDGKLWITKVLVLLAIKRGNTLSKSGNCLKNSTEWPRLSPFKDPLHIGGSVAYRSTAPGKRAHFFDQRQL